MEKVIISMRKDKRYYLSAVVGLSMSILQVCFAHDHALSNGKNRSYLYQTLVDHNSQTPDDWLVNVVKFEGIDDSEIVHQLGHYILADSGEFKKDGRIAARAAYYGLGAFPGDPVIESAVLRALEGSSEFEHDEFVREQIAISVAKWATNPEFIANVKGSLSIDPSASLVFNSVLRERPDADSLTRLRELDLNVSGEADSLEGDDKPRGDRGNGSSWFVKYLIIIGVVIFYLVLTRIRSGKRWWGGALVIMVSGLATYLSLRPGRVEIDDQARANSEERRVRSGRERESNPEFEAVRTPAFRSEIVKGKDLPEAVPEQDLAAIVWKSRVADLLDLMFTSNEVTSKDFAAILDRSIAIISKGRPEYVSVGEWREYLRVLIVGVVGQSVIAEAATGRLLSAIELELATRGRIENADVWIRAFEYAGRLNADVREGVFAKKDVLGDVLLRCIENDEVATGDVLEALLLFKRPEENGVESWVFDNIEVAGWLNRVLGRGDIENSVIESLVRGVGFRIEQEWDSGELASVLLSIVDNQRHPAGVRMRSVVALARSSDQLGFGSVSQQKITRLLEENVKMDGQADTDFAGGLALELAKSLRKSSKFDPGVFVSVIRGGYSDSMKIAVVSKLLDRGIVDITRISREFGDEDVIRAWVASRGGRNSPPEK